MTKSKHSYFFVVSEVFLQISQNFVAQFPGKSHFGKLGFLVFHLHVEQSAHHK